MIKSICACLLWLIPALAFGQTPKEPNCASSIKLSKPCQKDFDRWQKGEREWRAFMKRFSNQIPFGNTGKLLKHRHRPDSPGWLEPYCAQFKYQNTTTRSTCTLYEESLQYDWVQDVIKPSRPAPLFVGERPGLKEWFLKASHFDGLWTDGQVGSGARSYGLIGMHLTIGNIGRLHVWVPVGILLVRDANHEFKVKSTLGMDIYLLDAHFRSSQTAFKMFLTVAKVWDRDGVLARAGLSNMQTRQVMVGLSFTLR